MCNNEMQELLLWLAKRERTNRKQSEDELYAFKDLAKMEATAYFLVMVHIEHEFGHVLTSASKREAYEL